MDNRLLWTALSNHLSSRASRASVVTVCWSWTAGWRSHISSAASHVEGVHTEHHLFTAVAIHSAQLSRKLWTNLMTRIHFSITHQSWDSEDGSPLWWEDKVPFRSSQIFGGPHVAENIPSEPSAARDSRPLYPTKMDWSLTLQAYNTALKTLAAVTHHMSFKICMNFFILW